MSQRLFAVIVLYRTRVERCVSYRDLLRAADRLPEHEGRPPILLYDNSPEPCAPAELAAGVMYHHAARNDGVAGAYNHALALARGSDWLLTLDQDTSLPDHFLADMLDAARSLEAKTNVAAIVPQVFCNDRPISPHFYAAGAWPRFLPAGFLGLAGPGLFAINSASLLRVSAIKDLGGYDPAFWLDSSDLVLFARLARSGQRVYVLGSLRVQHSLSHLEPAAPLSPARLENNLAAESAFWDGEMTRWAGLAHTVFMVRHLLGMWRRREDPLLRRLLVRSIADRVVHTRRFRLARWRGAVAAAGREGHLYVETSPRSGVARLSSARPALASVSSQQTSACVSVVLCTYNGAVHLEQQLDSIAAQTILPLELIACDDGSTDATMDMLMAFQRRAPFEVKIFRNSARLGSTANFDQGLQRASGDFLALADQDDVWLPNKLATLVPLLESDPGLGGVFSDAHLLDSRAIRHAPIRRQTLWSMHGFTSSRQTTFASRDGAIGLLLQADVITGATLLIRGSLRPLWQPIPQSWVHDGWITWMLAVHARLLPVAEPLMLYRLHGEQQLGVGSASPLPERVRAIQQTERARYARVAGQFEEMLERLQSTGNDEVLAKQLRGKIDLLRRRAELPSRFISRVVSILRDGPAYWRYARGWRSMRKDLFLA